jgi:hypothetical protein
MAWLMGQATEGEIEELEARSWDVERIPASTLREFVNEDGHAGIDDGGGADYTCIRIWVDADVFGIMSGPDWEQGNANEGSSGDATRSSGGRTGPGQPR